MKQRLFGWIMVIMSCLTLAGVIFAFVQYRDMSRRKYGRVSPNAQSLFAEVQEWGVVEGELHISYQLRNESSDLLRVDEIVFMIGKDEVLHLFMSSCLVAPNSTLFDSITTFWREEDPPLDVRIEQTMHFKVKK